jgi:RNA polymerase sigma factor (sigma-70 family)
LSRREGDEHLPEWWRRYREEGDPEALALLLERYLPLVRVTIRKMVIVSISPEDREDLESRLTLRLLQSINSFEAEREGKFETFAVASLRGEVLDFWRSNRWEGRKVTADRLKGEPVPEHDLVSLTAALSLAEKVPDGAASTEDQALAKVEYDEAISYLLRLPKLEQQVLVGLYLRGVTKRDLAKELGWSPSWIHDIACRALAMLKKWVEDEG